MTALYSGLHLVVQSMINLKLLVKDLFTRVHMKLSTKIVLLKDTRSFAHSCDLAHITMINNKLSLGSKNI